MRGEDRHRLPRGVGAVAESFAFAAEMCFAVSVVVTTAVAKAASGIAEDPENLPRTATAAVTASFVSGGALAGRAATALAGPLPRPHARPGGDGAARANVCERARARTRSSPRSNAAEGVFVGQRATA